MTATTEDFDFSDVADGAETRESNVLSSPRTSRTGVKRGRRPAKRLGDLKEKLSGEVFQAGAMIGFGLPVTGYYLCQESADFAGAVVELASHRPEWLDALEKVADVGPGITAGRITLGTITALGVDRGRINPDKSVPAFLGVRKAFYAVHPEGSDNASQNGYSPPPFGAFVPVE